MRNVLSWSGNWFSSLMSWYWAAAWRAALAVSAGLAAGSGADRSGMVPASMLTGGVRYDEGCRVEQSEISAGYPQQAVSCRVNAGSMQRYRPANKTRGRPFLGRSLVLPGDQRYAGHSSLHLHIRIAADANFKRHAALEMEIRITAKPALAAVEHQVFLARRKCWAALSRPNVVSRFGCVQDFRTLMLIRLHAYPPFLCDQCDFSLRFFAFMLVSLYIIQRALHNFAHNLLLFVQNWKVFPRQKRSQNWLPGGKGMGLGYSPPWRFVRKTKPSVNIA